MLTSQALASTIMPVSDSDLFPLKKSRSKSSTATTFSRTYEDDFRDGLRIPLPPSSTSSQSEHGLPVETRGEERERSTEKERTHRLDDRVGEAGEDRLSIKSEAQGRDKGARDEKAEERIALDGKPDKTGGSEPVPREENMGSVGAEHPSAQESVETSQEEATRTPIRVTELGYQGFNQGIGESARVGNTLQGPEDKNLENTAVQVKSKDTEKPIERPKENSSDGSSERPLGGPPAGPSGTILEKAVEESNVPDLAAGNLSGPTTQSHQTLLTSSSIVSLQELGLLARKRDYDQQCLRAMQNEVQDLIHRCASIQRKICLQFHLYSLMLNHFRSENRVDFSSTYQQSVEARDSPTNAQGSLDSSVLGRNGGPSPLKDGWTSRLSPAGSKTVTQLLHQIREVPTFLPDCLANLSSFQIGSLSQKSPDHSAAPSPQPGSSIFSRSLDWSRHRPESISGAKSKSEEIRHSPLALIAYGAFDTACSPRCRERRILGERLVDSCARLISSGKKGSNDFVLSVLETLVESSPWPSKLQLEQYITKLIQDGDFVLESSEYQQLDFSEAATVNNARNAVATAEFYDRGLRSLLNLLTQDSSCNTLPDGMLEFIRAVLSKIQDAKQRSKARDFFVLRWYCSAFLSRALMYPEVSLKPLRATLYRTNFFTDSWLDDATSCKQRCSAKDSARDCQETATKCG